MQHFSFTPHGVCAVKIDFDIDGDAVKNIVFKGGCDGNHKAIARLAEGVSAKKVADLLSGNTCGFRNTSCADQLAAGIKQALVQTEKTDAD